MSYNSKIEWTETTWNPVTGCTKISDGCLNCYAATLAKRLKAMGNPRYINGFNVTLHYDLTNLPRKWEKPRKIFVNSMSDLLHKEVPNSFIIEVFKTMNETPQHIYQVLTKRPERLVEIVDRLHFSENIWIGVSVENEETVHRIDVLKKVDAKVRFISFEPLIGNVGDVNLQDIQWVIVGGESGPGARPVREEWVDNIHNCCIRDQSPFFFKQWGGVNKKKTGRLLHGQEWLEYPDVHNL